MYATTVLLLAMVVVGLIWLHLRATYRDTLAYWDSNLSSSADEQVSVGNLWLIERRTDTEALARNGFVLDLLKGTNPGNILETRQNVLRAIQHLSALNGFLGGVVADAKCGILAQTSVPAGEIAGVLEACREAQASGGFSVAAHAVETPHLWLNLALPVFVEVPTFGPNQEFRRELGVVVMFAEPWESPFRAFWQGSTPSQPVDTLIVWQEGAEALAFSPRLIAEQKKTVARLPLNGPAFESRVAREGKLEFDEFTDYRGVRVFGVAEPIALGGASVVRKVDKDRALAEFRRRALLEWAVGALFVLLFGSVIAALRRREATHELEEKIKQQQSLLDLKRHVEVSEEALRQSDKRYKDFISHSAEGVWRIEAEPPIPLDAPQDQVLERLLHRCYLAECNTAHARSLGFSSPEEAVGMSVGEAFPLLDSDQERLESMRSAIRGGFQTRSVEFRGLDSKGNFRDLIRTEIPIVENGLLVRVWGITRDITERKQAEEALRKLNAELEGRVMERTQQLNLTNRELEVRNNELSASNQELEAFSYSVAHDLRAPLRQIQGFSRLLQENHGPDLAPEAENYIGNITEGAKHMGRLIDHLLDLSRLGRRALRLEVRSLATLVEDARRDLAREIDGRDVRWKIGGLPLVECDGALMRQVFVNLISNALKYTQRRQPALIEIGEASVGDVPAVFVKDNGVGFNMKYADKLFGVFQRLHRRDEFEGTGIGLATVKRIIEKHGGRIWAEAEVDKGATFYFTLSTHRETALQGESLVTASQKPV